MWDGRVEVLAEGEKERLEDLIVRLKQGPPMAEVEKAEVTWEDFRGEFENFRIAWS
jgi:acylphosphatase